jgi:hypothetical protein
MVPVSRVEVSKKNAKQVNSLMCIVSVVSDWLTGGKEAQLGSSKRDRMYISVIRARCDGGS